MSLSPSERLWETADALFLNKLFRLTKMENGWIILCGHGVAEGPLAYASYDDRHVILSSFIEQMHLLLDEQYRFITLTEGIQRMMRGMPMEKLATVTFDDGLRAVVELAYPVMERLGLKGCLYVVSETVGSRRPLWTDTVTLVCWHNMGPQPVSLLFPDGAAEFPVATPGEVLHSAAAITQKLRKIREDQRRRVFEQIEEAFDRIPPENIPFEYGLVTWDQLRALDPGILEVGNHTATHPRLVGLEAKDLHEEIVGARKRIESELDREVCHFCYPGGAFDRAVRDSVQASGHLSATTGYFGWNRPSTPPLELRRVILDTAACRMKARLSGLEAFVRSARRPAKLLMERARRAIHLGVLAWVFCQNLLRDLDLPAGLLDSLAC